MWGREHFLLLKTSELESGASLACAISPTPSMCDCQVRKVPGTTNVTEFWLRHISPENNQEAQNI